MTRLQVSIVTVLQAGRSFVRIPAGERGFYLLQNIQTGSGAYTAFCSAVTGSFSPGVKRPRREVNHSPPYSVQVKNEWSYTFDLPIRLHGVDRDNSAFTIYVSITSRQTIYVHTFKNIQINFVAALMLISENDNAGVP
jgi:hypothetical protein